MGKRSPAPPPAPDYTTLAIKQGEANLAAAKQSAYMSNPNIYGPQGSQTVTWQKTPTIDTDAYNQALRAYQDRVAQYGPEGYAGEAPTQEQFTTYIEQPTVRQSINPNAEAALRQQELAQLYMSQAASGAASGLGNLGIASAFNASNIPGLEYRVPSAGGIDRSVVGGEQPGYTDFSFATQGINFGPTAGYTPYGAYNIEGLPGQIGAGQQARSDIVNQTGAAMPFDPEYYGLAGRGPQAPGDLGQISAQGFAPRNAPSGQDYGFAQGGPFAPQLQGLNLGGVGGVGEGVSGGAFGYAQGGPSGGLFGLASGGPQGLNLQGLDLSGIGGVAGGPQQGQFGYAQRFVGGPQLQGQIDMSGLAQGPVNAGMTAQTALLSRLSPQLQGERQQLQTQLINQGLRPGGEAYNAAMSAQMQKENDLLLQAAAQGISLDQAARQQGFAEQQSRAMFANQAALSGFGAGMEQAGLFNLGAQQDLQSSLATQAAQNQAQQQAFQQRVQAGEFGREAQLASFGTQQSAADAYNRAIGQNFGQYQSAQQMQNQAIQQNLQSQLAAEEAQRAAQSQRFGQAVGTTELGAQLAGQQFGMGQAANEAQNAAIAQNFQQALASQQAQNAAMGQGFGQTLGAGEFNRAGLMAQFGMGQQAQQMANEAISQNYNRSLSTRELQNAALQQVFNQALAQQQAQNAAAGQNFGQTAQAQELNLARQAQQAGQSGQLAQFYNQAQAQAMQQELARAQGQNAAQGQQFQQIVQQQEARNAALAQRFQQDMARQGAGNAAQQQQFQQNIAAQQFYNTAIQQALAQQAAIRSLPVNEISALLSGGQVSIPQFQGYSGVNVAPAPIFQAGQAQGDFAQRNYQNQVGAYNAQMGLFGDLAGAAGTAFASDRRLKSNVVRIGTHPLGIGIYEYDIFGERQRGVMADEVEAVKPEAVTTHPTEGYKMVYYGLL